MKKIFTLLAICLFIGANAQDEAVDSKLIKNGFYVESFGGIVTTDFNKGDSGFGLKLGNVWYFGSSDLWRPGFKTVWFRGATYFGDNGSTVQGSILNVGFANIIEFKPNLGLEANINFGYNIIYSENRYTGGSDFIGGGMMFNPELKFRFNVLAVGLDFVFTKAREFGDDDDYDSYYDYNSNTYINYNDSIKRKVGLTAINLSIGAKF
ncbi:MAG: hypothetical protein COA88_00140 [Kordia sp.]|nr:MAG: hypothetical protein COA88_00140 [Kordia sp.]